MSLVKESIKIVFLSDLVTIIKKFEEVKEKLFHLNYIMKINRMLKKK